MISSATQQICEAQITAVSGKQVSLLKDGDIVEATVAVMQPYTPSVGDTVLVIQESPESAAYVIGVLQALGPLSLQATRGDITIHAAQGAINCSASTSMNMEAPMVSVQAQSFVQRLGSLMRFVSGLMSSSCKQRHVKVDGSNVEHAERTRLSSEKEFTLNGSTIHMG